MWALAWKFRKYIAIGVLVSLLVGLTCAAVKSHDKEVASEAIHKYRMEQLKADSIKVDSIIKGYDAIVDSLEKLNAKEVPQRAAVQKHREKQATLQDVAQSEVDSFVAQITDSAVKVVVDSLQSLNAVVIARLNDRIRDGEIMETSLNREINRHLAVIKLKNDKIDELNFYNARLNSEIANMNPPPKKHSVGHFVVHKALPVVGLAVFTAVGVAKVIDELKDEDARQQDRYRAK